MSLKKAARNLFISFALLVSIVSVLFAQTLTVETPTLEVGESGTINFLISDCLDCAAVDLSIQFDSTKLQVDAVRIGTFLSSTGNSVLPLSTEFDNTIGEIHLAAISLNTGNPGAAGSGTLFSVDVTALEDGISPLAFLQAEVSSLDGTALAVTPVDGSMTIGGNTSDFVCSVQSVSDAVIGQSIAVSISCQNIPAPGAYGVQFCLNVDNAILTALDGDNDSSNGIQFANNAAPTNSSLNMVNDLANDGGCYGFALRGDVASMIGDEVFAVANFRAESSGTVNFSLSNVILSDSEGISLVNFSSQSATVLVNEGDLASLSGLIRRQAGPPQNILVSFDGQTASLSDNGDGSANFDFGLSLAANINATLRATSSGHLSCESSLSLLAGANVLENTITLLAGDVNGDGAIDIADAAAIGLDWNTSGTANLATDLNSDGLVTVNDLVFVGRNYLTSGIQPCTP